MKQILSLSLATLLAGAFAEGATRHLLDQIERELQIELPPSVQCLLARTPGCCPCADPNDGICYIFWCMNLEPGNVSLKEGAGCDCGRIRDGCEDLVPFFGQEESVAGLRKICEEVWVCCPAGGTTMADAFDTCVGEALDEGRIAAPDLSSLGGVPVLEGDGICERCPFCTGGMTADEGFLNDLWAGSNCSDVKKQAAVTPESSEHCSEIMRMEPYCCPSAAPSEAPSTTKSPSAAPSMINATSIERSCTQMVEIEAGKKFGRTEANAYEGIMENYTEQFGHMVGEPRIATTCDVTGQVVVGNDQPTTRVNDERELQTSLPLSYPMAINFTIRYESRYGYDVGTYPQQFKGYINSNLQQVTTDMSLIILEAKEVTVFDTVRPTGAMPEQAPAKPPVTENPIIMGLVIALPAGALIVALLIYYTRQWTTRSNAVREEDGDVQASPAAATFDFVFSNKTESDALCLEFRDKLTSHGVTVWQQRTNIPKDSDNWFEEWFPSAVKARKIVCFLTVQYLKSTHCTREFGIALNSNRLLVVACEPLNKIAEVDPSDYPDAATPLAYLLNGGQVIFHDSDDVIAEILKFADSSNDEEAEAHHNLSLVDKAHLMNGGQVIFHVSKEMAAKNLGGSSVTEEFDFVLSNKTESDAFCLGVRDKLISRGVTVWQQRTNIPKDSDNWFKEWFQSARKARKIVCFLTVDYVKSPYCMKEFGIALNTNKLLVVACDPVAKISKVDPSAYRKASNALAYLMNGGEVIIHDSEDVVAEIFKFARNPGAANPNEAEAEAQLKLRRTEDLTEHGDVISKTSGGGQQIVA